MLQPAAFKLMLPFTAPPLGSVWNPADKAASIALSNANQTMNNTASSWASVRGGTSRNSGKVYFEMLLVSAGANDAGCIGVGNSSANLSNYCGADLNAWGHLSDGYSTHGGYSAYGVSWGTTGSIVMIAIDFASGNMWIGKNGVWMASGNPATGANPTKTGLTGTLFPMGSSKYNGAGESLKLITSDAGFTYSKPLGFSEWG